MQSLVGSFGVPGSVVAILVAAYYAVQFYRSIRPDRADEAGRSHTRMSIEEYLELQKTRERIDAAAAVIVADVSKTRHDLRDVLGEVQLNIQGDIKDVSDVVGRIERLLLSGDRRSP